MDSSAPGVAKDGNGGVVGEDEGECGSVFQRLLVDKPSALHVDGILGAFLTVVDVEFGLVDASELSFQPESAAVGAARNHQEHTDEEQENGLFGRHFTQNGKKRLEY